MSENLARFIGEYSLLLHSVLFDRCSDEGCAKLVIRTLVMGVILGAVGIGDSEATEGELAVLHGEVNGAIAQPKPFPTMDAGQAYVRGDFVSLGPDQLISIAVAGNPSVLARRAEVISATKDVETARWQYFPTLGLSSQRLEGETSMTLSVRQPIWTGGRLGAGIAVAQARVGVSDKSLLERKFEIASRVVAVWGRVLGAHRRCDTHKSNITRLEDLKAMMIRRQATGLSSQVELDLVMARIAQAKSEYNQTFAELRGSLEALSQLVGMSLTIEQLKTVTEILAQSGTFGIKNDHAERAVDINPTVVRATAEIEYVGRQVNQAKRAIMPTLYAKYDMQHGQITGMLPADNRFYLVVEQSVGAGLSSVSAVDSVAAKHKAAHDERDAALRDAASRIVANVENYHAAVGYEHDMTANLDAQIRVADSYNRLFLAGKRSWLDLLNMIREQSDAEKQLAMAQVQRVVAEYLIRLDGGDFWRD